jgi:hypothetical protein
LALDQFIGPWSGFGYRHLPAASPFSPTDFRFAGKSSDNRWKEAGKPTLYVASDTGVAVAEFARHIARDYQQSLLAPPLKRRMYRLQFQLESVLDFCTPAAWSTLDGLTDAPFCFLDKELARTIASYVRVATPATAMRVPSVAFLDDLTRWSLVVFLEKVPSDPRTFITDIVEDANVYIGP